MILSSCEIVLRTNRGKVAEWGLGWLVPLCRADKGEKNIKLVLEDDWSRMEFLYVIMAGSHLPHV